MPWSVKKPTAVEIAPDWLQPYCKQFMQELAEQGYARCSLRIYDRAAAIFCSEVARRGFRKGELVGRKLSAALAAALEAMHLNKYDQKHFCLERFVNALVEAGVAERPSPRKKVPTAIERLAAEYQTYLREQRGLTDATIYHCVRFLHRFMAFRFGETFGNLNDITPDDIVRFLREVMGRKSPYRDRTPPTHLRSLFRFLFWSGKTKRDLAASLPRVAMGPRSCRARCSRRRSSDCSMRSGRPTPSGGATTRC